MFVKLVAVTSRKSRIQTVLADTPHGCSVTPSPANAVAATPMHRPELTPNGAYSISNALRFGKPLAPPPKCRLTAADTRPAAKKSATVPWKEMVQSWAGSKLAVRNRMIGWPTFWLCLNTSTTDPGPKTLLEVLRQDQPHDGVPAAAGPAVSALAAPTPPTRVSVAAAASTLLLMDIDGSSLGTHNRALRTAVPSWPRSARRILPRSLGTLPARGGLIRTVMSGLIGLAVPWGFSPPMRETRDTRRWLTRTCTHMWRRPREGPAPRGYSGANL